MEPVDLSLFVPLSLSISPSLPSSLYFLLTQLRTFVWKEDLGMLHPMINCE